MPCDKKLTVKRPIASDPKMKRKTKTLELGKKEKELSVVPEIRRRTKRAKIKKHNDAQTNILKIRTK